MIDPLDMGTRAGRPSGAGGGGYIRPAFPGRGAGSLAGVDRERQVAGPPHPLRLMTRPKHRPARFGNFPNPMALTRKKLLVAMLCSLIVWQACGVYRAEYRDYADVFVRYEAGALEVSVVGQWSELQNGDKVLGSPYLLLVRYVDAEGMQEAELLSLTLRERSTGAVVPLAAAQPESLTLIPRPGHIGFGPTGWDPLAVPPNRYVAFSFPDLRLKYQTHDVSGVLVLRGTDGVSRKIPFTGSLVPRPRKELRSGFADAFFSV